MKMIMQEVDKIEVIESLKNEDFSWALKEMNVEKFWENTKGENIKIAIIDTGIDMNHIDLKDNIKATINMHNRTTDVTDSFGHGSHVAGLLVGKNTGVAPEAELYIAKVLDDKGNGSMANVLDGITFAINYEVDILCMSLGVPHKLPKILIDRIEEAYRNNITIVCASGNSNINQVEYPAFLENVIGVGGVDKDLNRASFSNYGWEMDLVAPSTEILSTYKDGKYAKMSGTSMASPLVAGAIALIKSYFKKEYGKNLSPSEIKEILKSLNEEKTEELGYGFIDMCKILKICINISNK